MFWPFVQIDGQLTYCPLADFGAKTLREGDKLRAKAVIAQPVAAQHPLLNAQRVQGKIVLMERGGGCDFLTKVLHAQQAGAVAAIIANSCLNQHEDAVFVMDCGRRVEEASQVRIPALMISRKKAAMLFERIRNSELDREEFMLTIEFIGAKEAAFVLAEMETASNQDASSQRSKTSREKQQVQAAKLLRSRLGRDHPDEVALDKEQPAEEVSDTLSSCADTTEPEPGFAVDTARASSTTSNNSLITSNHHNFEFETLTNISSSRSDTSVERSFVRMDHTGLFVMDMQNYFLSPSCYVMSPDNSANQGQNYCHEHIQNSVLPNFKELLHVCRFHKVEIFYSVVQSLKRNGKDRSRAHKQAGLHLIKNSFDAQIHAHVAPVEDELIFSRTGINIFEATNLDYLLRNMEIQHLVIGGISHLQSIESMAASALDRGYQVTLLRDAIALPSQNDPNFAISKLEQMGCHISTTRTFITELLF